MCEIADIKIIHFLFLSVAQTWCHPKFLNKYYDDGVLLSCFLKIFIFFMSYVFTTSTQFFDSLFKKTACITSSKNKLKQSKNFLCAKMFYQVFKLTLQTVGVLDEFQKRFRHFAFETKS